MARVGMDRQAKHVGALVKNTLCPIAVLVVEVEDGNLGHPVIQQVLGGQRGIIQVAVAAAKIGARVVALRLRQHKGTSFTDAQGMRRIDRAVGAAFGRAPGTGTDAGDGIHRIQAKPGTEIFRLDVGAHGAYGKLLRDDHRVAEEFVPRLRLAPCIAQESQVTRAMRTFKRGKRHALRRHDLAQAAPFQFGLH